MHHVWLSFRSYSSFWRRLTAGFMSHPDNTSNSDKLDLQPQVMLENMGMSDPECSRINGRTFTASALWNLLPRNEKLPDLAIPRGEIIKEYNNPENPSQNKGSDQEITKTLLHKCLSQFSHWQRILGQHAVHYLWGNDDTMMSHSTVPMLSGLLLGHIHSLYVSKKKLRVIVNILKLMIQTLKMSNLSLAPSNLNLTKQGDWLKIINFWTIITVLKNVVV